MGTFNPAGSGATVTQGKKIKVDTSKGFTDLRKESYLAKAKKRAKEGGYSENKKIVVPEGENLDLREKTKQELKVQEEKIKAEEKERQEKNRVKVYLDYKQVEQMQKDFESVGIRNAQDFKDAERRGDLKYYGNGLYSVNYVQSETPVTLAQQQETSFFVERTVSPSETTPVPIDQKTFSLYQPKGTYLGSSINAQSNNTQVRIFANNSVLNQSSLNKSNSNNPFIYEVDKSFAETLTGSSVPKSFSDIGTKQSASGTVLFLGASFGKGVSETLVYPVADYLYDVKNRGFGKASLKFGGDVVSGTVSTVTNPIPFLIEEGKTLFTNPAEATGRGAGFYIFAKAGNKINPIKIGTNRIQIGDNKYVSRNLRVSAFDKVVWESKTLNPSYVEYLNKNELGYLYEQDLFISKVYSEKTKTALVEPAKPFTNKETILYDLDAKKVYNLVDDRVLDVKEIGEMEVSIGGGSFPDEETIKYDGLSGGGDAFSGFDKAFDKVNEFYKNKPVKRTFIDVEQGSSITTLENPSTVDFRLKINNQQSQFNIKLPAQSVKSVYSSLNNQAGITRTSLIQGSSSIIGSKTIQAPQLQTIQGLNQNQGGILGSLKKSKTTQVQKQVQEQVQVQVQTQVQTQVQQQKQVQKQLQVQRVVVKPQEFFLPKGRDSKKSIFNQGFDVFVKEKGVFRKVNFESYSKGQALTFGAGYVQTTPSASFFIKPSNSPAKPLKTYLGSGLGGFYSKGKVLIEKKKERINTIGELTGITYKGLNAKRNDSKLKKLYGR